MAFGDDFYKDAADAGFTEKQIEFLGYWLARTNHEHEISDVAGLADALSDDDGD